MRDPVRARLGWVGVTAGAFAGGLLLASGLDWTAGSHAATLFQTTARPPAGEVRPVAELSDAFISIAESVTPAVVAIETERRPERAPGPRRQREGQVPEGFPFPFPLPEDGARPPQGASGSGFLITEDGYVMTNNHVIADADEITVVLSDNRQMQARLVGRDPLTDVAVVKIEGRYPAVRLGRSEEVKIGEWVLAIGNPLDLGTTVTSGIVSAKGRALNNLIGQAAGNNGRWAIEDFIQTDAPINPGNSGGPLVNLRGEVVGMNSAIASPTGFYSGYGFAVPIDLARRIADDLIRYGRVRRPALGVQVTPVTPEDAEVYGLDRILGVVAQDFPDDSPAREAGLRQGDVIVGVGGQTVLRVGQFQRLVATRRPGETVVLDVVRYGARERVRVRLGEAPAGPAVEDQRQAARPAADGARLGVQVAAITPALVQRYRLQGVPAADAVVVTEVEDFGAAARYGLGPGIRITAVDGREVSGVEAFRRALDRHGAGDVVSLRVVFPSGEAGIVNVRLPR